MKKLTLTALLLTASIISVFAQDSDRILGDYRADYAGNSSKVRFSKGSDGTYYCKAYWVKDCLDKDGNKILDKKNPDKSLRNVPCDRIKIIWGMKYNAEKNCWEGGKIYDPTRGLRANAIISFTDDGRLRVRGQVMGIGETVYWTRLK